MVGLVFGVGFALVGVDGEGVKEVGVDFYFGKNRIGRGLEVSFSTVSVC